MGTQTPQSPYRAGGGTPEPRRVASGVTEIVPSPAPPVPIRRRRVVAFGLIALALAVLIPLTWVLQAAVVSRAGGEVQARTAQRETVAAVQARASALVGAMRREAVTVAALPAVQTALTDTARGASGGALAALHRRELTDFTSVEVYAPGLDLVAWRGGAFRLGVRATPDTLLSLAIADGAGRRALTAWAPVIASGETVGAVRVVRLAQAAVPVRNRFLQDYDVADDWRDEIEGPFEVLISSRQTPPTPEAVPLVGLANRIVGWVRVPVPSSGALTDGVRARFQAAMAFWAVLVLGWALVGLARLYVVLVRRAGRQNARRHWSEAAGALLTFGAALAATRFALLRLDVPVRWLGASRETPPLFDPLILASDLGWGLLRSPGDLALTALFALALAAAALVFALRYAASASPARGPIRAILSLGAVVAAGGLAARGVAAVARSAVLDAPQLGYADRTGPIMDGMLAVAMGSIVAVAAAGVCGVAAVALIAQRGMRQRGWLLMGLLAAGGGALAMVTAPDQPLAGGAALGLFGAVLGAVLHGRPERWGWPLTFRGMLTAVFVVAPVAYSFMVGPLGERTDALLADAAELFAGGRDERVTYALDQVLAEARADDALRPALLDAVAVADSLRRRGIVAPGPLAPAVPDTSDASLASLDSTRQSLDDLAAGLVQSSLLGSLADVAAELRFISPTGDTLGGFAEGGAPPAPAADVLAFSSMRDRYRERNEGGFFVGSAPSPDRRGLPRYAGIGPLAEGDGDPRAWIYVRATPRPARFASETPFPRVLAPAGLFGLDDEAVGYAEYDDGVRARGGDEAPFRLDPRASTPRSPRRARAAARQTETADGATVRGLLRPRRATTPATWWPSARPLATGSMCCWSCCGSPGRTGRRRDRVYLVGVPCGGVPGCCPAARPASATGAQPVPHRRPRERGADGRRGAAA